MTIEQDIFKRKRPDFSALVQFGFEKNGDVFSYSEAFHDGAFVAKIEIDQSGAASGKVIDVDADEEYLPLRIGSYTGSFVGEIRLEYANILQKIAERCFKNELFIFPQSNRVAEMIFDKYGESPDFPFETEKEFGVFRNPENKKWYALIMNVRRDRLTKEKADDPEKIPLIEVMNIKVGEDVLPGLIQNDGIYPAYHMNHKSWISIVLDETVPDAKVIELVDISRRFTIKTKSKVR